MQKIKFTIPGNQEDEIGNPIGYTRVIKQMWRADATRYMNWQEYVRKIYFKSIIAAPEIFFTQKLCKPFPRADKNKYSVGISVRWQNGHHADLDNVLKGILDALFENDSCVTDFKATSMPAADKKGKVEVEILAIK